MPLRQPSLMDGLKSTRSYERDRTPTKGGQSQDPLKSTRCGRINVNIRMLKSTRSYERDPDPLNQRGTIGWLKSTRSYERDPSPILCSFCSTSLNPPALTSGIAAVCGDRLDLSG